MGPPRPTTSRAERTLPPHLSRVNGLVGASPQTPGNYPGPCLWSWLWPCSAFLFPCCCISGSTSSTEWLLEHSFFILSLVSVAINPPKVNIGHKITCGPPLPTLNRSKHHHVMEDQYCSLCQGTVSAKTKHHSTCNKCAPGFVHHCKWLSNCVRSRNY